MEVGRSVSGGFSDTEQQGKGTVRANGSIDLAGVVAMACTQRGPDATRESDDIGLGDTKVQTL